MAFEFENPSKLRYTKRKELVGKCMYMHEDLQVLSPWGMPLGTL